MTNRQVLRDLLALMQYNARNSTALLRNAKVSAIYAGRCYIEIMKCAWLFFLTWSGYYGHSDS
jgi:hypothetical protein